jgi:3-hydroxy-9,10-secoandrosta-1,3,5(10)-triene-9,17-dione monooxygenase
MMHDDPNAKRLAAEVDCEIASMKNTLFQNFDHLMACARAGEFTSLLDRARFRYNTAIVADKCVALSSRMLKGAGSSAIRNKSNLLAQHQDILASQAHIANVSDPYSVNLGGMLFGQDSTDPSL